MLKQSQLDLCGRVDFTREVPLLGRDEGFSFACAGCGDCCRGREDIVLSGFDLWRIAARLRLPPRTVARAFCKASIGAVSHLPVLRLAPVREEGNNCPFLTHSRWSARSTRWRRRSPKRGASATFCSRPPAAGRSSQPKWGTIWPGTTSRRGRLRMCAGRRCAWRWKTGWRRWKRCSSRCLSGGCSKNSGKRFIIGTTSPRPFCLSWKKICADWTQNWKNCPRCKSEGTFVFVNQSKKLIDKITSIDNLGCCRIVFGQEMCYTSRV